MFGKRFNNLLICVVAINVCLLSVGSFIKSVTIANRNVTPVESDTKTGGVLVVNENRSEPYIVPRLGTFVAKEFAIVPSPTSEFNRKIWADAFLRKGEDVIFHSMKSMIPAEYSRTTDLVLGVTTIARQGASYLRDTLRSLVDKLGDYRNVTVVVYIGEEDEKLVNQITANVQGNFSSEVSSGLIKIVSPPKDFYPDWEVELRQSFGDSFQRVKWRSKQNIDQIFLMMYAYYLKPKYYLMLEDDILAANDYLSKIYMDAESHKDDNFVLISYCQLGAIGKLFRRELLPSISTFLSVFWSDKPLDWLMIDYMKSRMCDVSKGDKDCAERIKQVEIVYKPSLFQHIGTTSSLQGKVQKLKDKNFKP